MINCYVPCKFEVKPKGWLSRLLLRLKIFRYVVIIREP